MLVRDVMLPRVICVTPKTTLAEALRLADERGVRHLPVVDDGELVGIVSDRDFKRAMLPSATHPERPEVEPSMERVTVADFMTRDVLTVAPTQTVEDAARVMLEKRISALPVTEGGRLVGIVTETDILQLFVRALGAAEPSSRLTVLLDARPAALAEVVHTVEDIGLRVSSIVTLVQRGGFREAVVRVATINPGPVVRALRARGYLLRNPCRMGDQPS